MGTGHSFNISSSVIRQLGEELVTDEVTAIMELVKNSYDADASRVVIEINTQDKIDSESLFYKDSRPGYITIEDTGFGMDFDDIIRGWLYISVSGKRKMKAEFGKTPKGRIPLGEKGLGRLSTQKLGDRLEMITGQKGEDVSTHIAFSWADFKDDVAITDIEPHLDEVFKKNESAGTKIILTNLKDINAWKGDNLAKFRGQLSQLIFPIKDQRPFQIYLKVNGENLDLDDLNKNVRDTSVSHFNFGFDGDKATISGYLKYGRLIGQQDKDLLEAFEKLITVDEGREFFSFLTDATANKSYFIPDLVHVGEKGVYFSFKKEFDISTIQNLNKIPFSETQSQKEISKKDEFANPGKFSGEIDEYYFKSDNKSDAFNSLSELKLIIQNQAGVRVYRDGFGLKPYGMDANDWLGFGAGQTSGASFYGMRPKNVIGYVLITSEHNSKLREKTDREGFMDDAYSKNFFMIMNKITREINNIIVKTRRSFNDFRTAKGKEKGGFTSVNQSFTSVTKFANNQSKTLEKSKVMQSRIIELAKDVNEKSKSVAQNSIKDASLNKLIESINKLLADAQNILVEIEQTLGEASNLENFVEYLKPKFEVFERQIHDFSELASLGLIGEILSHELENITVGLEKKTKTVAADLLKKTNNNSLDEYLDYVRASIRSFKKQLSHLSPTLAYVRDVKSTFSIDAFLKPLAAYYQSMFVKDDIKVNLVINANFSIKCSEGRLTQVLDNLAFNSQYWLKVYKSSRLYDEESELIFTIEVSSPYIFVYDSGLGVESSIEQEIFQPFISGKSDGSGRGLGLFISQQLLETEGGSSVSLSFDRNQHKRRYKFVLDLSTLIQ